MKEMTNEAKIVNNVLRHNSYCATSESILLAGIFDNKQEMKIREDAKSKKHKSALPRKLQLPKSHINFNATDYFYLLDFEFLCKRHKKPFN